MMQTTPTGTTRAVAPGDGVLVSASPNAFFDVPDDAVARHAGSEAAS